MSLAVALGLVAGISVGGADFLGGLAARRRSPLAVALWSQIAASLALLGLLPLADAPPDAAAILWGRGSAAARARSASSAPWRAGRWASSRRSPAAA